MYKDLEEENATTTTHDNDGITPAPSTTTTNTTAGDNNTATSSPSKKPVHISHLVGWKSRWVVDFAPTVVVYVPEVFAKLQTFFSLLETQKNLRKQYQSMETEFKKMFSEGLLTQSQTLATPANTTPSTPAATTPSTPVPTTPSTPITPITPSNTTTTTTTTTTASTTATAPANEKKDNKGLMVKVTAKGLSVDLVGIIKAGEEGDDVDVMSILQVNIETILVTNHNDTVFDAGISRIDYFVSNCSVVLHTLPLTTAPSPVQSITVVYPVNLMTQLQVKTKAVSGLPYVHLQIDVDSFRAVFSMQKYQTTLRILQGYLSAFINPTEQTPQPTNVGEEGVAVKRKPSMLSDMVLEATVNHVNLAIVSDYVAELELFYIYMKKLNTNLVIYEEDMEFTVSTRFEMLVNNLNFLNAETFIEPFYLTISGKRQHNTTHSHATTTIDDAYSNGEVSTGDNNSITSISFVALDKVVVRMNQELMRHLMDIVKVQDDQNEMHSHFQFFLVNNTEEELFYAQSKTRAEKRLLPGKETSFSFPNPYQPKRLSMLLSPMTVMVLMTVSMMINIVASYLVPCNSSHPACTEMRLAGWTETEDFALDKAISYKVTLYPSEERRSATDSPYPSPSIAKRKKTGKHRMSAGGGLGANNDVPFYKNYLRKLSSVANFHHQVAMMEQ